MNKRINTVLAFFLWVSTISLAQSPFLDAAFADNGRFTHLFQQNLSSRLWCTALQADGKIVGAGFAYLNDSFRAAALRCNPDGSLDTSFGNGGEWISDDPYFAIVTQIIVQPDGKILMSGRSVSYFKVVRLMPNGDYDPDFGNDGKVSFPVWPSPDARSARDMVLQPNGKILITGHLDFSSDEIMITRIRENGTIDGSFGTFGTIKIKSNLFNATSFYGGSLLALSSDNKILAAIGANDSAGYSYNHIIRYSISGVRDFTFGENGVTSIPKVGFVSGLYILPGDSFYLLGSKFDGYVKSALYKFNAQGFPDSTFADNGLAKLSYNNTHSDPNSGYLQADGKVVVFGGNVNGVGFLGRFNQDGMPDSTFGANGTIAPETLYEIFYEGFVQPDGKIVAVGRFQTPDGSEVCSLLRYLGSNSVGIIEAPTAVNAPLTYPNPIAGDVVSIAYELPNASLVAVELMDMQGKLISVLLNAERPVGKNEEQLFLPSSLNNGFYLFNIRTNKGNAVVKLVLDRQ